MSSYKSLVTCVVFAWIVSSATAQPADDALLVRKTKNFDITGDGTASAWKTTEWIPLEKRKGSSTYSTQAKVLYSDQGIYALFSCKDKKITASFQEDFANLWTEDVVEIFFWPDESSAIYFEYELSPLNYELPILVPNMNGQFLGWRPWQYEGERKTRHATKIIKADNGETTAWIAEFFIPFALLKPLQNVPPKSGQSWRMNMYRIDYDNEYTSWSWRPVKTNFHDYERFGTIRFE
ncbi:MAG TPA: carbohydrate-binding family 9-like protein [Chryseosolibacter sp.]|nr:carbohydrate-binding family 9-like protein [Chryseosolibacter sp.]